MLFKRVAVASFVILFLVSGMVFAQVKGTQRGTTIKLPKPSLEGHMSVEQAIQGRRSVRNFADTPVSLKDVSQILWAAGGATVDGISGPTRAYPSAGALYPLDIYLVAGNVTDLEPGIYRYEWRKHDVVLLRSGDLRADLAKAALSQGMIQDAPFTIVVMAEHAKTARRYGQRGAVRYVSMDAGHLGQNVHLMAESMGLGTVMVGAFMDNEVVKVIDVKDELPIYMMPVGKEK